MKIYAKKKIAFNLQSILSQADGKIPLAILYVYFFQDYKYLVKKIKDYTKAHRNVCCDVKAIAIEAYYCILLVLKTS